MDDSSLSDDISASSLEVESAINFEEDADHALHTVVGDFPVGLFVWKLDTDGSIYLKFINRNAQDVTGLRPEEWLGKKVEQVIDPYLLTDYVSSLKHVHATGTEKDLGRVPNTFTQGLLKLKMVPLPNSCVAVFFENDIIELERKRKQSKSHIEMVLNSAIDMVMSDVPGSSEAWMGSMFGKLSSYLDTNGKEAGTIVFDEQRVITAGDVSSLIQHLQEKPTTDSDYTNQFLLTYRYFITPRLLLKNIMLRFISTTKLTDTKDKESVQLRLIHFIQRWVQEHFYDFTNDPDLLETLLNFLHSQVTRSEVNWAYMNIKNIIEEQQQFDSETMAELTVAELAKSNRGLSRNVKFLDLNPSEVANQLTLIAFEKFKDIKPIELYAQSWSKENKKSSSPNVVGLINNFNRFSYWVASEIVAHTSLKKRVQVLKHFIAVGHAACGYRDYETTFMIVLGLSQHSVSRLGETWKNLDEATKKQWAALAEFTNLSSNCKNYRLHMKKIFSSSRSHNVMPYFGLYLKDLTFIEDGNNNYTGTGVVNFQKMRMVADVMTEIQTAQQSKFGFQKNLRILAYLMYGLAIFDEDTIYEKSKLCEAPEPKQSSPASGKVLVKSTSFREKIGLGNSDESAVKNPLFGKRHPYLASLGKAKSLTSFLK